MDLKRLSFFILLGTLLAVFVSWQPSLAQITKTLRVELTDSDNKVFVGRNIQVYPDPNHKLYFETLNTRYKNNPGASPQDSNVLNAGLANTPFWLVFSVTNTSAQNHWLLNFGNVFDGRMSHIKSLNVFQNSTEKNHGSADQALVFSYNQKKSGRVKNSIPILIEQGKTEYFIAYVETAGFLPSTLVPNIVNANADFEKIFTDLPLVLFFTFLIAALGILAGSMITYKSPNNIGFFLYYLSLLIFFIGLNDTTLVNSSFSANLLSSLFSLNIIMGVVAAKLFLKINARHYISNLMLYALAGFVGVTSLISLLLPESSDLLKSVLVFVPSFMAIAAISLVSFAQVSRTKNAGYYFCLAWIPVLIGLLVTGLSAAGTIGTNSFTVNAYWISLLPQAALFLSAIKYRFQLDKAKVKTTQAREIHEIQSIERLKKSKESVDQARLIRVIERERELMAELREREMKRTEEMRKARNMADGANRAKSAFLAVISHEIRTPLNGLMGTLRMLNETNMSKEQNDLLGTIRQSCDNMMVMLNDILDFEKIEKGHMDLEIIRFDILKLVQEIITLMSGHARDKEISLSFEIDETIPRFLMGDPTRLRQVLLNLINNAVKFTDTGSVKLILKNESQDSDSEAKPVSRVLFSVVDTGIGISKEAQKDLFDPFRQADESISRKFGGTGLGLAICKNIVEAMGSTLTVESEEMRGSTFHFTIGLEKAEGSSGQATISEKLEKNITDVSPLDILIVEDNEINRKVLRSFLEKYSHRVTSASSGEEALELCQKQEFDIMFFDIWLPKMSGTETAIMVRNLPSNPNATKPIVAITGTTSPESLEEIKNAGINGYIQKPIDFDQLLKTLAEVDEKKKDPDTSESNMKISPPTEMSQAPIQQFVNSPSFEESINPKPEQKEEEPSQDENITLEEKEEVEQPPPETIPGLDSEWFDINVLNSLSSALSPEQVEELFQGFSEKADEIIKILSSALLEEDEEMDMKDLQERGHELKGMAANFGMSELADIAKTIEDQAKLGNQDAVINAIAQLPTANQNAKKVIRHWTEKRREEESATPEE